MAFNPDDFDAAREQLDAAIETMTNEQRAAFDGMIESIKNISTLPKKSQLAIARHFVKFFKLNEEDMNLVMQYDATIKQLKDLIQMYKTCVNKQSGFDMAIWCCNWIDRTPADHIALHESKKKFEAKVLSDLHDFLQIHIDAKDEQIYKMFAAVTTFKEYCTTRDFNIDDITINNHDFFAKICKYTNLYDYCIAMDEAQYSEIVHDLERQLDEIEINREALLG